MGERSYDELRRLYEEERAARENAERAAARLANLQAVTDAALAHLSVDALLDALLGRVRDILRADTCSVLLLDPDRDELVARAALGIEEEVEQGVRIPVGRGFAGRVAAGRRPVILDDVDHADVLNPILRDKGIKSLLGVPLIADGALTGVLHVGTLAPRAFDDADVELLQLVADRIAIAVEHARALEAERRTRVRLEHVQAVTDVALAHLGLDELFAEVLVRIRDILRVDTCAVLLLDEQRTELVARAALGLEEEVEQEVRIPFGRGFAGRVAATREPVVLPDIDRADVLNPILREKGIKSLLGVPLLVGGDPIGVVHVGSLTPRDFTRDDVELLQVVAERVALAIEKARVHEEMVRLDELKLNFVAVASHELRTPATSVYGIVATLRERHDTLSDETRRELEEVLWTQVVRLRRLIEQLLDLSRLDGDRVQLELRPLPLADVLAEVVAALDAPGEPPVTVALERDVTVVADVLTIDRVVSNLVANAQQHGRPPIVVSAGRTDGVLQIAVEDDGDGVAPEVRPRLFEPFERGTYDSRGSGLGLAIARAYARAHGGDVVYAPRERGARFEFSLPVHGPPPRRRRMR